jgi:hypothetical protein
MVPAPYNQCVAAEGGKTLVMHLRRFASAERNRYPASFTRVGSSCQVIGWRLTSSQNKQTDKD